MFKLIKRLIILIVILLVLAFGGIIIFLNSVKVDITEADLPQDVYDSSGNLETMMENKMISIATSDEADTNSHFEDFLNMMIFTTIRDNINPDYDPLNGDSEESEYIVEHKQFTLDYIIAEMTEDDQVNLTVSIKRNSFPEAITAIYFYFDMEVNRASMTFILTLDKVYLDDKEISQRIYDYFVSFADKDQIESQVDKGTLDLDNYTYEVSFADLLPDLFPDL
ncbi:MAG: hypothetical protein K9L64_06600 [Candidatus Izimaplasma sp.]|nr:hypothetical protein [Candidatus Izimaplasma bacterium]